MTPAARLAAAIEILDRLDASRLPADELLKAWGRAHRFAGSKDRRAIADEVYRALRGRAYGEWRLGPGGRNLVLAACGRGPETIEALFNGEGHAPSPLTEEERARLEAPTGPTPDHVRSGAPAWLEPLLRDSLGEDWIEEARAAILERAPVDLRVNALMGDVPGALRLLAHEEVVPARTELSPFGLRLAPEFARDVHELKAYRTGWIEVQDEASQTAALLSGARPGDLVLDYCAGAGGKTLALAAMMGGEGRLIAADLDPRRLEAMRERLERARARAEIRRLDHEGRGVEDITGRCAVVFVDAPCSGSGTWRRRPEAAWRLTPQALERLCALQPVIARRAADALRPGGRLVYATCSLFRAENEAVAAEIAARRPELAPLSIRTALRGSAFTAQAQGRLAALAGEGHTLQLTPRRAGTDGFFVALFQRTTET